MRTRLAVRACCFCFIAWLAQWPLPPMSAEAPVDQQTIVRRLRFEEGIVRSMHCVYEERVQPTRPDMVALFRDFCARSGKPQDVSRFVYTDEMAKQRSRLVRYWRDGDRERFESVPLHDSAQNPSIDAFDGQFVRRVAGDEQTGAIRSIGTSSRFATVEPRPSGFLHKYYNSIHYSTIVEKGRDLVIKPESKGFTHVLVRASNNDQVFFEMHFDSKGRLVLRHYKIGKDHSAPPAETHEFFDYQRHPNPSGEEIWFPRRVVYHYFAERHPNGTVMEFSDTTFLIKDLSFNLDIPDPMFTVRFPSNAKIWDGVTNRGFLSPGERPSDLFPEEPGSPWWLISGISLTIVALAIALFLLRRRFKQRAHPAAPA